MEESEEKQLAVNNLEDPNSKYRAIFATYNLNEGWDVLIFSVLFICMILGLLICLLFLYILFDLTLLT